jgi:hypothetical protein
MNFKLVALFAFVLPLAIACQQDAENDKEPESQEQASEQEQDASQQNQLAPQQSQRVPGANQPAAEVSEVSDEELKNFISASQEVQAYSQQIQQQMVSAVEDQGIQAQRFSEIQRGQQNPNSEMDVSQEEMKKFQAASQAVQKIQMEAQQEMQNKLSEVGLTQKRYQEISMMVQSDPELQQKYQSMQQGQQ